MSALERCRLCPHLCGARRESGESGFCRCDTRDNVASICMHRGEEPPISGPHGICNVFFAGCNMRCRFCQNHQISRMERGEPRAFTETPAVVESVLSTVGRHEASVGFVSPSHVLPAMRRILAGVRARRPGTVFVYNTNAYDRADSIAGLADEIDVYLPDFKYAHDRLAVELSAAPDYPRVALKAIREMVRQKGVELKLARDGRVVSGVIIRHLVLPGHVENSLDCLRRIAETCSNRVFVSLMSQYHPTPSVAHDPVLGRALRAEEYDAVVDELERLGFENGWVQGLSSSDHYLPDFEEEHPFERET